MDIHSALFAAPPGIREVRCRQIGRSVNARTAECLGGVIAWPENAFVMDPSGPLFRPRSYRLGYRAIEGLRAVTILLVVAAHANVGVFAAGFVGVDVFFVLSGYLITVAHFERSTSGTVRFGELRAACAALPALLLMLLCVCAGLTLLARADQPDAIAAPPRPSGSASALRPCAAGLSAGREDSLFLHVVARRRGQFYLVWRYSSCCCCWSSVAGAGQECAA
jgi:hypothetical protein